MTTPPEVMTAAEAAEFLRTRPETLKRLARQGKVPGAKLGHEWRFLRQDLADFLAGAYEAQVDRGLVEMARERMADGEDEWIPLEQVRKDLGL
ncbi:MAG: helix-turn-helix domain-containing protein [Armatimonadetes bacterium]|nr:helix-turn-helix domain-containing protein [Armatimonadota bacterium]